MKLNECKMKVMWDVGSGLGGASEAFLVAGWTVIRIENNPNLEWVPHTRLLDILDWREWVDELIIEFGPPDLIWCSPPCRDFSNAFSSPRAVWGREHPNGPEFEPDMSLVFACQDLLTRVRPRHWIIENVAGAVRYFTPHLGHYFQKIESFFLWGVCPTILIDGNWSHSKMDGDTWSDDPLRANRRAYVPMVISQAVLEAVTHQKTLQEWC